MRTTGHWINGAYPLGHAFQNVLAATAEYPAFQNTGRHASVVLTNDPFTVKAHVHSPKLGWVRMHEALGFVGTVMEGTISRTGDRWFWRVPVEMPDPPRARRGNHAVVGARHALDRRELCGAEGLCRCVEDPAPVIEPLPSADGGRPRPVQFVVKE